MKAVELLDFERLERMFLAWVGFQESWYRLFATVSEVLVYAELQTMRSAKRQCSVV